MKLTIPIHAGTEVADKEVDAWIKKTQAEKDIDLKVAVDPGPAQQGLKQVATEAEKTSKATEGIFTQLKVERFVSALSPAKDLIQKTGVELGLMSQKSEDAAVDMLDLAAKGAAAGAALGPVGAVIGAVAGALASLVKNYEENKKSIADFFAAFIPGIGKSDEAILKGMDEVKEGLAQVTSRTRDASGAAVILKDRQDKAAEGMKDVGKAAKKATPDLKEHTDVLAEMGRRYYAIAQGAEAAARALDPQRRINPADVTSEDKTLQDQMRSAGRIDTLRQRVDAERDAAVDITAIEAQLSKDTSAIMDTQAEHEKDVLAQRQAAYASFGSSVQTVFSAVGAQIERNIANQDKLLKGAGAAAESAVGGILKGLGRQYFVKALGEAAEAISWAFVPGGQPIAAGHAAAAAGFGLAAAAAGLGGVALSGDAARRQSAPGAAAPAGPITQTATQFVGGSLRDPGSSNGGGVTVHVHTGLLVGDSEEARIKLGQHVERSLRAYGRAGPHLNYGS